MGCAVSKEAPFERRNGNEASNGAVFYSCFRSPANGPSEETRRSEEERGGEEARRAGEAREAGRARG